MSRKIKLTRGSGNVFEDLGFPKEEARHLALRAELMIRIGNFVERSGLTQAMAAKRLGLTQPRLNAMMKGRIELFSLDALVRAATLAGLHVELRVTASKPRAARAMTGVAARA